VAEKEHKAEQGHEGGGGGGGHGGGGHGTGGAHEEHEGAPEWLISFADNVALIMGFFVILLAMNMKEPMAGGIGGKEKNGGAPEPSTRMIDFVIAMRENFNNPIDLTSSNPGEEVYRRRIREKAQAGQSLQPEEPGQGRIDQAILPTEVSSLGGNVPFEDEADSLSGKGKERAEEIGRRLRGQRWIIDVRGHSSPSETQRDTVRGIELSHKRAVAVANVLVSKGVRWEQLRLVACGDNERNARRQYDRDADRVNQRVEVIITGDPIADEAGGAGAPPK
jgi:flagellar motor protein MotB